MPTFTIAHLSDIHLAPGARGAEPRRLFAWTVADLEARVAAGLRLDAIVLNGDIRDGADTPAERNLLAEGVQRLANLAPVVVVYGNHDRPGDLDFLARLESRFRVDVYADPAVHVVANSVVVVVLPWLDRVAPADDVRTYSVDAAAAREQAALVTILDKLAADAADATRSGWNGPVVFCGHLMLEGAVPGLGQPKKHGTEFILTLADLARVPAAAYLLGHVHTAQRWTIGAAPVVYNGSLHRSAFGETEAKGYTLLTLDGDGVATLEHVATPATPMVLLEDAWEAYDPEDDRPAGWASVRWSRPPHTADVAGADVRFQYTVAHADRAAARRAAQDVKVRLEAAGARCKLDPVVSAPVRPKLPAFAAAQSLDDKLTCWLDRERIDHAAPKSRLARALLGQLERALGTVRGGVAAGGMRLHKLTVGGIGPFLTPVELDLDALPGEVVAIRGKNGAGKSTLLGCWPAAMSGRMPDKRRLATLETGDSAIVHAEVSGPGGARWTLERHVSRGKAFARAVGAEAPVDESGGLTRFETWADEHLVPREVLLNGPFAPQKSAGLVAMTPGPRKEVLLAAMGCDHYERMAKAAREKHAACKAKLDTLAGQIAAEERRRAALPPDPGAATATARVERARAVERLTAAEQAHAARVAALDALATRARATEAVSVAEAALGRLEAQTAERGALLEQAEAIREAAARDVEIAEQLRELDAAGARIEAEAGREGGRRREMAQRWSDAERSCLDAQKRADAARLTLGGEEDAEGMGVREERLLAAMRKDAEQIATLTAYRLTLAATQSDGLLGRVNALRRALEGIGNTNTLHDAQLWAARALEVDDLTAEGEGATRSRLDAMATELATLTAARDARAAEHRALADAIAARRATEERARLDLDAALAAGGTATATRDALVAELRAIDDRLVELDSDATQNAVERRELRAARATLEPLATLTPALARAEAARDALAPSLAAAAERLAAARAALGALPPAPDAPAPESGPTVAALRAVAEKAATAVALAEQQASDAEALDATLANLRAQRSGIEEERDAWGLLADALGRNGIQAMEIDAAGPDLTQRINGLLHAHFGTRWTVLVDTTRANDKGEQIDGLPILVLDAENGREEDISTYSPGECTILGCALAGALAGYVCARTGAEGPTIVLDESGAAVDAENTEPYVAMVRQVATEIGASKVLLVTHSPEVASLCDGVVTVADGALSASFRAR